MQHVAINIDKLHRLAGTTSVGTHHTFSALLHPIPCRAQRVPAVVLP
jgi:hypothetical protein